MAIGADGTVYVPTYIRGPVGRHTGKLYALDGETGKTKWEAKLKTHPKGSPAIGSDGTVYLVIDDYVCALDGENGDLKWEWMRPDFRPGRDPLQAIFALHTLPAI